MIALLGGDARARRLVCHDRARWAVAPQSAPNRPLRQSAGRGVRGCSTPIRVMATSWPLRTTSGNGHRCRARDSFRREALVRRSQPTIVKAGVPSGGAALLVGAYLGRLARWDERLVTIEARLRIDIFGACVRLRRTGRCDFVSVSVRGAGLHFGITGETLRSIG
jgi:hypothetical protein